MHVLCVVCYGHMIEALYCMWKNFGGVKYWLMSCMYSYNCDYKRKYLEGKKLAKGILLANFPTYCIICLPSQ